MRPWSTHRRPSVRRTLGEHVPVSGRAGCPVHSVWSWRSASWPSCAPRFAAQCPWHGTRRAHPRERAIDRGGRHASRRPSGYANDAVVGSPGRHLYLCAGHHAALLPKPRQHPDGPVRPPSRRALQQLPERRRRSVRRHLDVGDLATPERRPDRVIGRYLNGYDSLEIPPGWDSWFAFHQTRENMAIYRDYDVNDHGVRRHFGNDDNEYSTRVLGGSCGASWPSSRSSRSSRCSRRARRTRQPIPIPRTTAVPGLQLPLRRPTTRPMSRTSRPGSARTACCATASTTRSRSCADANWRRSPASTARSPRPSRRSAQMAVSPTPGSSSPRTTALCSASTG